MTVFYNESEGYVKLSIALKIEHALEKYNLKEASTYWTPMVRDTLTLFEKDTSQPLDSPPWPYTQLVGELLWIANVLHVNIAFAVNILARYMQKPKHIHWEAAKRVLCYLSGTKDLGIVYWMQGDQCPTAYSDSDWAGDLMDRKSVARHVFMLNGGPVAWKSCKQMVVAKSTAEAEYLAVSFCTCEAIWFHHLFQEINRPFNDEPIMIYVDNQAVIQMTQNPVYLSKTKHIDIPVHHVWDEVEKGCILLSHIDGVNNPTDILTKPLPPASHEKCVKLLGLA